MFYSLLRKYLILTITHLFWAQSVAWPVLGLISLSPAVYSAPNEDYQPTDDETKKPVDLLHDRLMKQYQKIAIKLFGTEEEENRDIGDKSQKFSELADAEERINYLKEVENNPKKRKEFINVLIRQESHEAILRFKAKKSGIPVQENPIDNLFEFKLTPIQISYGHMGAITDYTSYVSQEHLIRDEDGKYREIVANFKSKELKDKFIEDELKKVKDQVEKGEVNFKKSKNIFPKLRKQYLMADRTEMKDWWTDDYYFWVVPQKDKDIQELYQMMLTAKEMVEQLLSTYKETLEDTYFVVLANYVDNVYLPFMDLRNQFWIEKENYRYMDKLRKSLNLKWDIRQMSVEDVYQMTYKGLMQTAQNNIIKSNAFLNASKEEKDKISKILATVAEDNLKVKGGKISQKDIDEFKEKYLDLMMEKKIIGAKEAIQFLDIISESDLLPLEKLTRIFENSERFRLVQTEDKHLIEFAPTVKYLTRGEGAKSYLRIGSHHHYMRSLKLHQINKHLNALDFYNTIMPEQEKGIEIPHSCQTVDGGGLPGFAPYTNLKTDPKEQELFIDALLGPNFELAFTEYGADAEMGSMGIDASFKLDPENPQYGQISGLRPMYVYDHAWKGVSAFAKHDSIFKQLAEYLWEGGAIFDNSDESRILPNVDDINHFDQASKILQSKIIITIRNEGKDDELKKYKGQNVIKTSISKDELNYLSAQIEDIFKFTDIKRKCESESTPECETDENGIISDPTGADPLYSHNEFLFKRFTQLQDNLFDWKIYFANDLNEFESNRTSYKLPELNTSAWLIRTPLGILAYELENLNLKNAEFKSSERRERFYSILRETCKESKHNSWNNSIFEICNGEIARKNSQRKTENDGERIAELLYRKLLPFLNKENNFDTHPSEIRAIKSVYPYIKSIYKKLQENDLLKKAQISEYKFLQQSLGASPRVDKEIAVRKQVSVNNRWAILRLSFFQLNKEILNSHPTEGFLRLWNKIYTNVAKMDRPLQPMMAQEVLSERDMFSMWQETIDKFNNQYAGLFHTPFDNDKLAYQKIIDINDSNLFEEKDFDKALDSVTYDLDNSAAKEAYNATAEQPEFIDMLAVLDIYKLRHIEDPKVQLQKLEQWFDDNPNVKPEEYTSEIAQMYIMKLDNQIKRPLYRHLMRESAYKQQQMRPTSIKRLCDFNHVFRDQDFQNLYYATIPAQKEVSQKYGVEEMEIIQERLSDMTDEEFNRTIATLPLQIFFLMAAFSAGAVLGVPALIWSLLLIGTGVFFTGAQLLLSWDRIEAAENMKELERFGIVPHSSVEGAEGGFMEKGYRSVYLEIFFSITLLNPLFKAARALRLKGNFIKKDILGLKNAAGELGKEEKQIYKRLAHEYSMKHQALALIGKTDIAPTIYQIVKDGKNWNKSFSKLVDSLSDAQIAESWASQSAKYFYDDIKYFDHFLDTLKIEKRVTKAKAVNQKFKKQIKDSSRLVRWRAKFNIWLKKKNLKLATDYKHYTKLRNEVKSMIANGQTHKSALKEVLERNHNFSEVMVNVRISPKNIPHFMAAQGGVAQSNRIPMLGLFRYIPKTLNTIVDYIVPDAVKKYFSTGKKSMFFGPLRAFLNDQSFIYMNTWAQRVMFKRMSSAKNYLMDLNEIEKAAKEVYLGGSGHFQLSDRVVKAYQETIQKRIIENKNKIEFIASKGRKNIAREDLAILNQLEKENTLLMEHNEKLIDDVATNAYKYLESKNKGPLVNLFNLIKRKDKYGKNIIKQGPDAFKKLIKDNDPHALALLRRVPSKEFYQGISKHTEDEAHEIIKIFSKYDGISTQFDDHKNILMLLLLKKRNEILYLI
ncbi:MAG: hypothetical protein H6622_13670 [Halobacteriovoraceae bacterium]|nr:hypothetical protein [Halobacteriovoraceae bacterium]